MKKTLRTIKFGVLFAGLAFTGMSFAQTYTFTSGAATGNVGPTQAEMDAEYTGTNLAGNVTVTAGIQTWTVPTSGNYSIECYGGQGYGPFGGRGAHIYGEFNLTAGTVLKILVGQQAGPYLNFPAATYNHQFGGGGGSFVTDPSNSPYVVAGGGGGSHAAAYIATCDGQITQSGAAGVNGSITGAGGTNGNGGQQASSADAGGGLLTNGAGIAGGLSFVNGGAGGIDEGTGGFGCGGGTSSWNNYRGGGGGGYSGGGGSNNGGTCCPSAGGGGSFNNGSNPVNLPGVQLGDGLIVITSLCAPTGLAADAATLPDVTHACIIDSVPSVPTATNSCATAIPGTPDVTFPVTTVGTTVVTWTWDDGVDIVTQTQNLIITGNDISDPVPDAATLADLEGACSVDAPFPAPSATDNCDGPMFGTPDVTFPITTQGLTVVTWSFTDGNGNTATQTQNVTVNDTTFPVLDQVALNDLEACNSVSPFVTPTASDNCAGAINGVADVTFPLTTPGLTVVTWSFDDGGGNITTQTQNMTVLTVDNSTSVSGTTITADGAGLTYQWINCETNDPIFAETNQTYTPTVTGEYAVIVSNGTCTDTSSCVLVDFTGISELESDLISIYPNPTSSGVFTVDFDGNVDEIIVVDALGRTIELPTELATGSVDGSTLAAGKYTVKVITSDSIYTKGLVILK